MHRGILGELSFGCFVNVWVRVEKLHLAAKIVELAHKRTPIVKTVYTGVKANYEKNQLKKIGTK